VRAGPLSLYVQAGGIKTHVYVDGAGDGTPVVFVHGGGLGSNAHSWLRTMAFLAPYRRSYAPDMVGFGYSDAPAIAYDTQLMLHHLASFLDVLCLDRVILVGHSLGATIVARLTVAHPERVAACVMVAPGGGALGLTYHSDGHAVMARVLAEPSRENIRALAALVHGGETDLEADVEERLALARRPGHLEAVRAYAAAAPAPALTDRLPNSPGPLMLVWGGRERFNPGEIGDRIAEKLPNLKRYVVFEDAGHYIQYDEPERFPQTLYDFFDEVEVA
jgi:pimeloyl-ACP methyl ester carboxylesterase